MIDLQRQLKFMTLYLQRMVDEEDLQFHEEYMNEEDPSILHFLLASEDDVWCPAFLIFVNRLRRLLKKSCTFL